MTEVFVEQPLALPGSANYDNFSEINMFNFFVKMSICDKVHCKSVNSKLIPPPPLDANLNLQ